MELRVVCQTNENLKNAKLLIIQFLMKEGVYVDSTQCSKQELRFKSNKEAESPYEHWSKGLNNFFKTKRPSVFSRK
jgi:hypothetical protein